MIILATTLFILFLIIVFHEEERKMFHDDLLREANVFVMTSKKKNGYISGVGKGISSGKTAPTPKTLPVRRPKENEE